MRIRHFIFIAFILIPVAALTGSPSGDRAHDFHVSVMRVDHNAGAQTLEVAVKLFIDDVETSVVLLGGPELKLGSAKEHPESDDFIFQYLNNRLAFSVDGEEKSLSYVGKEAEIDVLWCYFEVTDVPQVKELSLRNQLLLEQFEDQSNLVHIHVGGEQKSMLLRKGSDEDTLQF